MRTDHHTDGHQARHHYQHHPDGPPVDPDRGDRRRRSHRGPGHGRGGRGRMARGDVRAAVLNLLAERPMHGYELMQAIRERSGGRWAPSPGAVYPAINQLEDEGLVTVTASSGRKVVTLTDAGRRQAETDSTASSELFAEADATPARPDLRNLLEQLHAATRQIGRSGTDAQVEAAATILSEARRSIYLLLADGPEGRGR